MGRSISSLAAPMRLRVRAIGPGLIGQGLSFVAMLLPIAFSPHRAIIDLAICAGIATGVAAFANLALPFTYPSIASDREAAVSLKASGVFLWGCGAVLCVGYGVLRSLGTAEPQLLGSAALLVTMCLDDGMMAWLIRSGDARGISENRLKYGITNVVLTAPVAVLVTWRWSLVASSCAVYLVSMAWVMFARRHKAWPVVRAAAKSSSQDAVAYVRANLIHAAGFLIAGFLGIAVASVLPELGQGAAGWAAVASVCGGFGTAISRLIGPGVDAAVSAAARGGGWSSVPAAVAPDAVMGAILSGLAFPASVGLAYVLHYFRPLSTGHAVVIVAAAGLYWLTMGVRAVFLNTMSLMGVRRTQVIWNITQTVTLVLAVVVVRSYTAILVIGAIVAVWNAAYLAIVVTTLLRRARSPLAPNTLPPR